MSADWISNLALIAAYDMRQGQFVWFNKAYETNRKKYQEFIKNSTSHETIVESRLMKIERVAIGRFMEVKDRIESGRIMEIEKPAELEVQDSLAMKEGVYVKG